MRPAFELWGNVPATYFKEEVIMTRSLFHLRVTVKDDERALLTRDGLFERILEPGKHVLFDRKREYAAEVIKIVRAEFPAPRAMLIASTHPPVAQAHFEIVQTGADEVAIVSLDGEPKHLLPPFTARAFWKGVTKIDVERVDTQNVLRMEPRVAAKLDLARTVLAYDTQINAHETGLLSVDGVLTDVLAPGRHTFWQVHRKIAVQKFDLRPQPIEVTAQEILTKDRIGLRVTLTAFYRIVDARAALQGASDLSTALYRLIQFAVREAVATRTLDDILAARDRIDAEIRAFVTERSGALGVETTELGIKDVILPGDVRDLLNKVVEAERTAKANLIRRQEETAATRSLLNTAKLMEENPLLLRLKELETLEKLVEKVGKIDLHAGSGAGLDALLQGLWKLKSEAA